MDGNRFDDLTKTLAGPRSRRGFLGLIGAAVGGIIAGAPQADAAPPTTKPSKCYGSGSHCTNAKQCCSGICTNRRCAAEGGSSGCISPADCPGQDTECQKRTCGAGVCGIEYVPAGSPTNQQKPGDCAAEVCDGSGGVIVTYDGSDVPPSPSQCLISICGADGQPQFLPVGAGVPCNENGGTMCDGVGNCNNGGGQCIFPADCAGEDTECQKRTCYAGLCGMDFAPGGSVISQQIQGDCKLLVCDGLGNITGKPDPNDAPITGNECKVGICGADQLPNTYLLPYGTPCNQDGGTICDGSGSCVAA